MLEAEAEARKVAAVLRKAGYVALFAGGCVRDKLLGAEPQDFDIATDATPGQIESLFPRTVAVGAQFGVICVLQNGHEFQVATFRNDDAYIDGRHPHAVHFSTPEEDALRRDFTINGMFYDPEKEEVIDYVGGQADLKARILRTVGDPEARFREDRLRLLRAVRFATKLNLRIEDATWKAIQQNASTVVSVSAERIREELVKLFACANRAAGLDLLRDSGLLEAVLPEVAALQGCEQPPQFHPEGDVYVHTRIMLDLLPSNVPDTVVWAVLLHDIGKPRTYHVDPEGRIRFNNHDKVGADMARALMTRLRFSNHEIDSVCEMVAQHMVFKDVKQMRPARLRRFMSRPTFEEEMELHRVDCTSSHGMLDNYEFLREKQEEFQNEPLIPPPLVTGHDLIRIGLTPGPVFGEILEAVQTLQLEGALTDREQALAWVRQNHAPQRTDPGNDPNP
jgi:poly(A) polymerase